ncbi:hypothetical protein NSMS1_51470 [Nostoc sp. MS1]|nr:hypothetical protein NSMS1_51470 [Nostoc sp. MS1]
MGRCSLLLVEWEKPTPNTNSKFKIRLGKFPTAGNPPTELSAFKIKKVILSTGLGVCICIRFFVKWYNPSQEGTGENSFGLCTNDQFPITLKRVQP